MRPLQLGLHGFGAEPLVQMMADSGLKSSARMRRLAQRGPGV
ncbi:hypothetical protein [Hymenobacter sp. HSC-4F20]|nr:hypothetical protein [Hymenobacter sp. HSC-4F20]